MPDLQLGCSAVLSCLAGKGGVRPHISKPCVLLRPSVRVQELPGWELASNPGSWEAAARAQRGSVGRPVLQEALAAVGICRLLKASPIAPGFVSSQRVAGNSSISLHENAAADAEKFLQ